MQELVELSREYIEDRTYIYEYRCKIADLALTANDKAITDFAKLVLGVSAVIERGKLT